MASRHPGRTQALSADNLGLTVLLALPYLALVGVTGHLVGGTVVALVALVLGADLLARNVSVLMRLLFRVRDRYSLETASALAERLLITAVALLAAPGPITLVFSFLAGRVGGMVVTVALYARDGGTLRPRFQQDRLLEMQRVGPPLALRA